ncbi:TPA: hypothetical protein ACGO7N_000757, partial [Streptococcus suis]
WIKHQNSHFSLKTVKKTNTKTMFVCNLRATVVALLCNSDNLVTQIALKLFKPVKLSIRGWI